MHVCPHCVHPFTSSRAFEDHFPDCSKHVYQRTIYPEPQSDESCLVPVHDDSGVLVEHVSSGFCAYTVSTDPEFETEPMTYSGRDCMRIFYDHLEANSTESRPS
jgi:hypothetical protein